MKKSEFEPVMLRPETAIARNVTQCIHERLLTDSCSACENARSGFRVFHFATMEKAIWLPIEDWMRLFELMVQLEMDGKLAHMVLEPKGLPEIERQQLIRISEFVEKLGAQIKTYVEGYHETTRQDRQDN